MELQEFVLTKELGPCILKSEINAFPNIVKLRLSKKSYLTIMRKANVLQLFLLAVFILIFCDRAFTYFGMTKKSILKRKVEKVDHNTIIAVVCAIKNALTISTKIIHLKD